MGLGLAYELGRRGVSDVLVLERSYLNAGASGRNGGGVRAQWSTPTMVRLGMRSLEIFSPVRGGDGRERVVPARRLPVPRPRRPPPAAAGAQPRGAARPAACARASSRPRRRPRSSPSSTPRGFVAGSWNPDDGVVFPWPFLWGYAARAQAGGARVRTFCPVTGFEISGGQVRAVVTPAGRVECETVVNACGAWSAETAPPGRGPTPEPADPPRDPRHRAAEALARPARVGARHRALLLAVAAGRDRGRHGRSGRAGGNRVRFHRCDSWPVSHARSPASRP